MKMVDYENDNMQQQGSVIIKCIVKNSVELTTQTYISMFSFSFRNAL